MKFKVGQRVKCIAEHDGNIDIIGKTGKIICHIDENLYGIEFDKEIEHGHNCRDIDVDTMKEVYGKDGHCWNIRAKKLRPYNKNKRVE
jgi:hypothetical protein